MAWMGTTSSRARFCGRRRKSRGRTPAARCFVFRQPWKTLRLPAPASGSSARSPSDHASLSDGTASSSRRWRGIAAEMDTAFCWVSGVNEKRVTKLRLLSRSARESRVSGNGSKVSEQHRQPRRILLQAGCQARRAPTGPPMPPSGTIFPPMLSQKNSTYR